MDVSKIYGSKIFFSYCKLIGRTLSIFSLSENNLLFRNWVDDIDIYVKDIIVNDNHVNKHSMNELKLGGSQSLFYYF